MNPDVLTGALAAALAAGGVYMLCVPGRRGGRRSRRNPGATVRSLLTRVGLGSVKPSEAVASLVVAFAAGAGIGFALFGGAVPSLASGGLVACLPVSSLKARHERRRGEARAAWPRILEELRLLACSGGRPVPQALFEAGRRAPADLRPAFESAEREWMLTTDFRRTADVLKAGLADATADAVCETLVVAHELGGAELDGRLSVLIEDRLVDLEGRRDANSRQAGARFARAFVLLVPLGMTLAGLSIGAGRSAYDSVGGQFAVVAGILVVAVCWIWSGRLMRLPEEPRVFR